MRVNRFSVALIAATSASLALVTPVAAAQTADANGNASGLSAECQAEVDQAKADHAAQAEAGGSSFMGPQELLMGAVNGYGSSGMPETPECAQPETEEEREEQALSQLPDWAQSAVPSPEAREAFAWIGAILGLVGGAAQLLTIVASINPAVLDPIRSALKAAGIKL